MKWLSDDLKDLRELYTKQLRLLLSAEEQIVRDLQSMVSFATDEALRDAFRTHKLETDNQIKRLEEILEAEKAHNAALTDISPEKNKAMSALLTEAEDLLKDTRNTAVRDAGLIAAAQRVEHYEIAAYGAVRRFAQILGETRAAELLDISIKEEGHADHLLTEIAERVNQDARPTTAVA